MIRKVNIKQNLKKSEKGKKKHQNGSDEEFDALLKDFLIKKAPMLKRLSKK